MMKTPLALAAALALIPAAHAQPVDNDETVDALLACRDIAEESQRLACLDAGMADFAAAIEEGRLQVVERDAIRAIERESFGLSMPSVAGLGAMFRGGGEARGEAETETLEDGAVVANKDTGLFIDTSKMHVLEHAGEYFSVKGPLNASRPRPRRPRDPRPRGSPPP